MYKYQYDDGFDLRVSYSHAKNESEFFEEIERLDLYDKLLDYNKILFKMPERPIFTLTEKVLFYRNLTGMLESGMAKNDVLRKMQSIYTKKKQRKLLEDMASGIEKGFFLSTIMKGYDTFDDEEVTLMEIGEKSGNLTSALENLCDLIMYKQQNKSTMKSLLIYPILIVTLMYIAGVVGLVGLLPEFREMMNLDEATPLLIQTLDIADTLAQYPYWMFGAVYIGVGYLIYALRGTVSKAVTWLSFKIKPLRKIILQFANARFIMYFQIMYASGVQPVEIFKSLKLNTVGQYKEVYGDIEERLTTGHKINTSMDERHFLPIVIGGIMAGEESGDLDKNLKSMNEFLTFQNDMLQKKLVDYLPMAILLILGIFIGWAASNILLPMYFSIVNQA